MGDTVSKNSLRILRARRLGAVQAKLESLTRDLETHEAMGSPAWLNAPEQYQTHLKRIRRFESERQLLERQLEPSRTKRLWWFIAAVIMCMIGAACALILKK